MTSARPMAPKNRGFLNALARAAGEGGANPDFELIAGGLVSSAGAMDQFSELPETLRRAARAEKPARAVGTNVGAVAVAAQ